MTVGWLGRLVEIKDVLLLVGVMEANLRRSERIRFVIAGDGKQRSLIEAAVQRWGDRVRWFGWRRDVTGVIAQCDVLVQTSRCEGTPIALIQGMAAGRPFVSTPAGGVIDMVSGPLLRETRGCRWYSNAALVDPDPAAFASALSEMQGDSGLVAGMGQKAAEFAIANYNLASLAVNYDRLYSELLASKKRSTRVERRVTKPTEPVVP
jgi:glycosyltransferase involved in cell wall biosynthesis